MPSNSSDMLCKTSRSASASVAMRRHANDATMPLRTGFSVHRQRARARGHAAAVTAHRKTSDARSGLERPSRVRAAKASAYCGTSDVRKGTICWR